MRTQPAADPMIRLAIAPTLARYPTEAQWQELETRLRDALARMPYQTLPESLAMEPAASVLEAWKERHWLGESARWLP